MTTEGWVGAATCAWVLLVAGHVVAGLVFVRSGAWVALAATLSALGAGLAGLPWWLVVPMAVVSTFLGAASLASGQ